MLLLTISYQCQLFRSTDTYPLYIPHICNSTLMFPHTPTYFYPLLNVYVVWIPLSPFALMSLLSSLSCYHSTAVHFCNKSNPQKGIIYACLSLSLLVLLQTVSTFLNIWNTIAAISCLHTPLTSTYLKTLLRTIYRCPPTLIERSESTKEIKQKLAIPFLIPPRQRKNISQLCNVFMQIPYWRTLAWFVHTDSYMISVDNAQKRCLSTYLSNKDSEVLFFQ